MSADGLGANGGPQTAIAAFRVGWLADSASVEHFPGIELASFSISRQSAPSAMASKGSRTVEYLPYRFPSRAYGAGWVWSGRRKGRGSRKSVFSSSFVQGRDRPRPVNVATWQVRALNCPYPAELSNSPAGPTFSTALASSGARECRVLPGGELRVGPSGDPIQPAPAELTHHLVLKQ